MIVENALIPRRRLRAISAIMWLPDPIAVPWTRLALSSAPQVRRGDRIGGSRARSAMTRQKIPSGLPKGGSFYARVPLRTPKNPIIF